jgi:hypothetical protein
MLRAPVPETYDLQVLVRYGQVAQALLRLARSIQRRVE